AAPPFAYAVFCPPYLYGQSYFAAWGPFFASHGIVLATMDAADPEDYPPRRARGLEQLMVALRAENTRADSPLHGKIAEARGGVVGWSMGGGAVLTVTGTHPEWKSAVLIAPNTATSSGYGASANETTVPTLIVNGALDTSVLGGLNQSESAYAALPASTPKLFYLHANLGHFDWGTPEAGGAMAGRYVMLWEKTFLEGDVRYLEFLKTPGPSATKWQSNL
ncbi:MAG TPA: hypothetical protein VFT23_01640, partial [Burkholderiales bacterium]|nr:hypothetical protein [Burkholderiales bacterium]